MDSFSRTTRRIAAVGIAALLLFAPLAFGSVESWAVLVLETALFVLGAIWLAGRAVAGRGRASTGLELPILAFTGLVLLQLAPMPRGLLSVVSPRPAGLYARTVPGYAGGPAAPFDEWMLSAGSAQAAAVQAGAAASVPMPATYSVPDTLDRLVLFLAFALAFFITADLTRDPRLFRRFFVWIVFVGMGIAIQGIFQKLTWNGKILWFREPGAVTHPFGPFVNPNHFAGFMELVVPPALGLLLTLLSRRAAFGYRLEAGEEDDASDARGFPEFLTRDEPPSGHLPWAATSGGSKAVLLGFLLALSLASIFLSLSRGGMMATALTFALFSPLIAPPRVTARLRPRAFAGLLALLALGFGAAFWFGAGLLPQRLTDLKTLGSEPSYLERVQAWRGTLRLFLDHPLIGSGLGSFDTAFSGYYPPGIFGIWKQAHNEYLQLLAEAGIVGMFLALLALAIFARRHVLPALRDRATPGRYLVLGVAMAFVSILLHSLVDFSLQIPAVGFLFVVLAGLLAGAAAGRSGERPPAGNRSFLAAGAVLFLILACGNAALGFGRITAARLAAAARAEPASGPALELLERGLRAAPGRPEPAAALGDRIMEVFDADIGGIPAKAREGRALLGRAEAVFRRVTEAKPLWSWGWWGLCQTYARRSELQRMEGPIDLDRLVPAGEEDLSRDARIALASIRTALLLEPGSFRLYDELAWLYEQEGLTDKAVGAYRESARLLPVYDQHGWKPVTGLPDPVYRAILAGMDAAASAPDAMNPELLQREMGRLASLRGDLPEAEKRYRAALAGAPRKLMADVIAADLGEVLRREGKTTEALSVLEEATQGKILGWAAWLSIARIRAAAGERAGAAEAVRAAIEAAPDEGWVQLVLARELAAAGDRAAAIGRLEDAERVGVATAESREFRVRLLLEEGRTREALAGAEALTADYPDRGDLKDLAASIRKKLEPGP